jgi:hypothetical protein
MKKREIDCGNTEEFSRILVLRNCELNEDGQQKKKHTMPHQWTSSRCKVAFL